MEPLVCAQCEKKFERSKRLRSRAKTRGRQKTYCSQKCVNQYNRKYPPDEAALREKIRTILKSVHRRVHVSQCSHGLTIDEAMDLLEAQERKCAVTGVPLDLTAENPLLRPSLDRVNNDAGYTLHNVQWVCRGYNFLKNACDDKSALEALTLMAAYSIKKNGC